MRDLEPFRRMLADYARAARARRTAQAVLKETFAAWDNPDNDTELMDERLADAVRAVNATTPAYNAARNALEDAILAANLDGGE